jgi:hypothetical protein
MLVCCTVPWQIIIWILFSIKQHKFILGIVILVQIITASKETSKLEMNQISDQLKN